MAKSLESRRRASGFRSSPSRAVQSRIDQWRLADNKIPYELGQGAFVEDVAVRDGAIVRVEREELSTTWDDTRTMNFLSTESDCSEDGEVGPPVEVLPPGFGTGSFLSSFPVGDCAQWFGGWSFVDWSESSSEHRLARNRRIVLQNRRLVYDSSVPTAVPEEIESEFAEREFLFQPFVPLAQHWKASTGHIWAGDSYVELEASARSFWLEPSGNPGIYINEETLERLRLTDSTLGPQRVKGDVPVVGVFGDRQIPWSEREFISPYGFYDEVLKEDRAGVQIVAQDGKGLEAFGFANPSVVNYHSNLNTSDFVKERQVPVRARRGVGSDNFDWLPRSARHVWLMRPVQEFVQWETGSNGNNVFEDWDQTAVRIGSSSLPPNPPTSEQLRQLYVFEDYTDEYRSLRRAPRRLKDITDKTFVGRNGFDFVRTDVWTQPYDPTEKGEPTLARDRKASSILSGGGLFLGGVLPEVAPFGRTPQDDKTFASGDNFVLPKTQFDAERSLFSEDEWMIEVGFSTPLGNPDLIKADLDFNFTLSGWNTERFLLSTSPEGGIPYDEADSLSAIGGEVRPRNGFALSVSVIPSISNSGFVNAAIVVANLYLVQKDQTRVARSLHIVPKDWIDGSFSGRVIATKKGNEFEVRLQSYSVNEFFDSEASSQTVDALFGFGTQKKIVLNGFKVLDDVLVIPSVRSTRLFDLPNAELLIEDEDETNPWARSDEPSVSRILRKEDTEDELLDCFRHNAFYNKPFGLLINGIALHDVYVSDVNDLEAEVYRNSGLAWSNWLGSSTRNNVVNFLDIFDSLSSVGLEISPGEGNVFTFNTALSTFTSGLTLRRTPDQFIGRFLEPGDQRFRKLSEGVLVGQWKAGSLWNRPVDQNGIGLSGESLTRPWGTEINRLLETKEDLLGQGDSRKHLTRVLDEAGVLTTTLPTHSSWGARFESRENYEGVVKNDYLRNREALPTFFTDVGQEDAFFGVVRLPDRTRERPTNYNVCVWFTLFDAEKAFVPPPQSISNPTAIEKRQRIWEYGGIGKLELVANGEILYLESTTYNTDVSGSVFDECKLRVRITPEMIGVPLHIAFGEITVDTPEAPSPPPPGEAGRLEHKLGFLIVDDVDLDSFVAGDVNRLSKYFLPSEPDDPQGRFKFRLYPNRDPKDIQQPDGFVHMGQPVVDLQCDYVVGSVEMRYWLFDAVRTNGQLGTGGPFDFSVPVGNEEPFFDTTVLPDETTLVFVPRFPLLREWAFSRAQSLWGYTGQSRILPDHYGVSSIDGVGVDLFSDGKFNIAGGLEDVEEAEDVLNFIQSGFPSLFFSDKRLDYSRFRVAGYELTKSTDRPQLFEVFDRSLARNKFEKGDDDSLFSLVYPEGDRSYIALNEDRNEEIVNIVPRRESVQLLRRLWFGRGINSPVEPFPELSFTESDDWFAGERVYPIYTPALSSTSILNVKDELQKIVERLEKVVDIKGFDEFVSDFGTSVPSVNVFIPLDGIAESSSIFSRYPESKKFGELELQRLRNLNYPWVKADGSNVRLTSLPLYRDLGNETKTSEAQPQEPPFYELVRVGFWEDDVDSLGNVKPIPQFPTYSLKFRGDNLSESANANYETNVLGNLCFEREVTVWGFAETVNDRLLPKFDTDEGSGLPSAYRIQTEDLGLVQGEYEPDDEFLDRRVWRRLKGGRQLLRTQRGRDRLERALGAFGVDSGDVLWPLPTVVSPDDEDKRFSKAFLGKGRSGWASAIWSVSTEETDSVKLVNRLYVDTLPPSPLTFLKTFGMERFAYERTNKVPDLTAFKQRAQEGWRHKKAQRALREEISGSPSPINAGMDGLNPFPSFESVGFNTMLFGSPRWTAYDKSLQREFARTLQLALFPNGGFDDVLLKRAKNLWLELTGNQAFPAWLEWARPVGGWNTRGSLDAMLPFFRYPFATIGELDRIIAFRAAGRVQAPATARALVEANRIFERELFENGEDSVLDQGELLLLDRLSTFDDQFPVTNLGYNYRFVRNVAGRLDANLEKQIAVDVRRVQPINLQELDGLVYDGNLAINGTGTFTLNSSGDTWTFSGVFEPGTWNGLTYKLFFNQNDIFASARAGAWIRLDEPGAPMPTGDDFFISAGYGGSRISKEPVDFSNLYEDNLWFVEAPIFFRFIGPNNEIEAFAYEDGDALNGTEVILGQGIIDLETGQFAISFDLNVPTTFTPPGIVGFDNEDVEVDEEVELDDEVVLDGGPSIPFETVDVGFYWFEAPEIVDARNDILSETELSLVLAIILWQEGGYEPEAYVVIQTFVLETITDALTVLGTVAPLALQNVLNRYRANERFGYLRHTLVSQRVSKTLLKLWYGTGDSLSREDYAHWWRGVDSFVVEQGNEEPTLSPLKDFDLFTRRDVLEKYNSESLEGGPYRPPNEGGNYSVWQKPAEISRFVTTLRPFGPDVRVMNYQNKQHWTRDIKLQDRGRIHDVWSLRHAHPQEMMQDVTVKPRGWRYGLLDVTPSGARWAINPRHWGYASDIARIVPEGATLNENAAGIFPTVAVILVGTEENPVQSRNKDAFCRSFDPFIETFEPSEKENLLAIQELKELAQTTTTPISIEKAELTSKRLNENFVRFIEAQEQETFEEIQTQKASCFTLFGEMNAALIKN
jgi:hypothetical protein